MKHEDKDKQANDVAGQPLTLGASIRQAREKKGISGRRLAAMINMHHGYLSRLEAGDYQRPSPEIIERIAAALGISYDDLFAMAGHHAPSSLPGYAPYIRAKFDVDEQTLSLLNEHFERLRQKYSIRERRDSHQVKGFDGPLPDIDVHAV